MKLQNHFSSRMDEVHPLLRMAFIVRRGAFGIAIILNAVAIVWTFSSDPGVPSFIPAPEGFRNWFWYNGYLRNMIAYGVMAAFYLTAFPRYLAVKLAIGLSIMSILFEVLQLVVPTRDFSFLDMLNSVAGILLAYYSVGYAKRWYWKISSKNDGPPVPPITPNG